MAATIETLFRQYINDTGESPTVPDSRVFKYLDAALDKLANVTNYTIKEDITISSSDITNRYKDLSNGIIEILSSELPGQDEYWEVYKEKRIRFIDVSYISAGTYEFEYRAKYIHFDGTTKADASLDYPQSAAVDLAVVLYALGLYSQAEHRILDKDGAVDFIRSKSEEGISLTYGSGDITSPQQLMTMAIKMMMEATNATNLMFTVKA